MEQPCSKQKETQVIQSISRKNANKCSRFFYFNLAKKFFLNYLFGIMKKINTLILLALATSVLVAQQSRKVETLETGWKFYNADETSAQNITFDDSKWESVRVPHDWAIGKNFDMNIDYQLMQVWQDGERTKRLRTGRTGALPCFGIGWYRIQLDIPAEMKGKKVFVEFDGAMSNAKVFFNGEYAGEWPFGYASFEVDVSKFVKFGEKNVMAVRINNKPLSSRWYSGAGLYRNVHLTYKNPLHIVRNGIYITTANIAKNKASVAVKATLSLPEQASKIAYKIISPDNKIVASAENTDVSKEIFIDVENPQLWGIKSPNLYKLDATVLDKNGNKIDNTQVRFGIRSISFDKKKGFFLNGKKTIINGVCMHHDMGSIGAATNVRALRRQLEILKEMGCNAIRTSHNPPSPELVMLCDEMGFLLQLEVFDEWKTPKMDNGYNKLWENWAEKDLVSAIQRDRNSPSVFMWSIGNEIPDQKQKDGAKLARYLVDIAHREDATRPVTMGIDNWKAAFKKSKIPQELDVVGINYRAFRYADFIKENPKMTFHGSETASTVSSRGVYHFPVERNKNPFNEDYHVSAYDLDTPPWGQTPDEEFMALDDNPEYFGEFVWTGFDYLGEPTPYNPGTPAKSSYFGIVDLAGLKKDRFYSYQARWNNDVKVLHVFPHWNWEEDRLGRNVPIHCYTNYDKVELFVNGKSMGVKTKIANSENPLERNRMMWNDVIYQPGEIKVVAYDKDGKKADEKTIKTAGKPFTTKITPDRTDIIACPKELVFLEIDVVDKDGNICPRASRFMFVKVKGAGKLRALCNGDPTDHTPFSADYMKSFNGKLVATIEPTDEAGEIEVAVYGMNLKQNIIKLKTKKPISIK